MKRRTRVSWLRVVLLAGGAIALIPMSALFGFYGFGATLVFILLVAMTD